MAEKTAAQKRAQKAYMEKFVRVEIRMDAMQRTALQAHAEAHSESVNGFINRAIQEAMERDTSIRLPEAAGSPSEAVVVSLPSDTLKAAQEAAGEAVPAFVARAVETQAQRDEMGRRMKGGDEHVGKGTAKSD